MQAGVLGEVLGVFLEALEMAWKVRFWYGQIDLHLHLISPHARHIERDDDCNQKKKKSTNRIPMCGVRVGEPVKGN